MDAQLRLIPRPQARPGHEGHPTSTSTLTGADPAEAPAQWRIDDGARERGRAGISRARQALESARQPLRSDRHSTAA